MNVIVDIQLKKPPLLSIAVIIKPLEKHFTYRYSSTGAERSPILAVYAVYQRMMPMASLVFIRTLPVFNLQRYTFFFVQHYIFQKKSP